MATADLEACRALAWLQKQETDSIDVLFTSGPYGEQRNYPGDTADGEPMNASLPPAEWVEWMRPIVREACRVSKGIAFFNHSDAVENFAYKNGPEWLHADLTRLDGLLAVRPYIWVKSGPGFEDRGNGVPGSGSSHYHRNDYEPIYGYAEPGKLPPHWSDNTAFGLTPVHCSHGEFAARGKDGARANDPWNKGERGAGFSGRTKDGEKKLGARTTSQTRKKADGERLRDGEYTEPTIANAGNVLRVRVGGGAMGHALAHETDAPMPLGVAERFVCWFCPPDGTVGDCFLGSGTTAHAALMHGRNFKGCDLRPSQIELTKRRLKSVSTSIFSLSEVGE